MSQEKGLLKPRAYQFALAVIKFIDTLDNRNFTTQTISKQLVRLANMLASSIITLKQKRAKKL
jgi:hypothetical protein